MLSSIHPLGERTRHNRWTMTTASFTIGAVLTGAALGAVLGGLGQILGGNRIGTDLRLVGLAAAAIAAAMADRLKVPAPGPKRQVNERWLGSYRGWVYGAGFGAQLGTGLATHVVTWAVHATLLGAMIASSPIPGAIIGATFGLGRSVALWAGAFIDRPSRLRGFHQMMRRLAEPAALATGLGLVLAGGIGLVVAL